MSTSIRSESKTSRPNATTLVALLATLCLLVAPVSLARPADAGPAEETSLVIEMIQDLYEGLGRLVANAGVVLDPFGRPDGSDATGEPVAGEAISEPAQEPADTEGSAVLDPLG